MQQQIIAGAGVVVKINGTVAGFATSIAVTRDQGVKTIHGIDMMQAQELAITGPFTVRGSLSGFRLRGSNSPDGFGIVNASTINDMFYQKYCIIEIVDRKTGVTIGTIKEVIFPQDSFQVQAKGLSTFTANFIGIYYLNENSDFKNPQGFDSN